MYIYFMRTRSFKGNAVSFVEIYVTVYSVAELTMPEKFVTHNLSSKLFIPKESNAECRSDPSTSSYIFVLLPFSHDY